MEASNGARILIIDDEEEICRLLELTVASWGMCGDGFSDPPLALDRIKQTCYDIALVDVRIHNTSGLNLMPDILASCPDIRIIIMTGYADKDTAIKALKLGAFDFLEKPLDRTILSHSISRALDARDRDRSVKELINDLRRSEAELLQHKNSLESLNSELLDTNRALSVLARNIERERDQMEKRIAIKLKSMIIPSIEKLKRDKSLTKYEMELDMLTKQIEDLTVGFGTDAVVASNLSATELRIASLVKNGLTSEEIAGHLNISISTVRTHRKNIRKKLRINNAQYSLRNYLHSKSGPTADPLLHSSEK